MRRMYYYVGVNAGGLSFVTSYDRSTHTAVWNTNKKPLALSKTVATDIAEGLCMNLICAVVVQAFFELEEHFTKAEEE